MIPISIDDPQVIARADFWWERCLLRMFRSGARRELQLRELLQPARNQIGDLVWPTT